MSAPSTPDPMTSLCDDLAAEMRSLRVVLEALPPAEWSTPTPAEGWSVADQVAHLWFFDERARLSMTDADGFALDLRRMMAGAGIDEALHVGRALSAPDLLQRWVEGGTDLLAAARSAEPSRRVPWYGPAMSVRSSVTARLMETWAHGQDVVDAVGVERTPTNRLHHVAHIGVRARPYAYSIRGRDLPAEGVAVVLEAPDGSTWEWSDGGEEQSIRGTALDFCLVVTQRRHPADTGLVAEGAAAREWLEIAQAFAGPPGPGRPPTGRRSA